jgi:mono/diheme cytochrome c family protein
MLYCERRIDRGGEHMNRRIAVALLVVVMLAGACSGKEGAGTSAPVSPTGAAVSDGAALVQKRCTICHTIERIDTAKLDRSGWEETVNVMIDKGATLNDTERNTVIGYLSSR